MGVLPGQRRRIVDDGLQRDVMDDADQPWREHGGGLKSGQILGATDGHSFRHLAATMTGASQEAYADMMLAGGRSVEGNRSRSGKDKPAKAAKSKAKTGSKARSKRG